MIADFTCLATALRASMSSSGMDQPAVRSSTFAYGSGCGDVTTSRYVVVFGLIEYIGDWGGPEWVDRLRCALSARARCSRARCRRAESVKASGAGISKLRKCSPAVRRL